MAKFTCKGTPDLVVSTSVGFIQFNDHKYTTTKKAEMEALRKCKDVSEEKKKAPAQEAPQETPPTSGLLG